MTVRNQVILLVLGRAALVSHAFTTTVDNLQMPSSLARSPERHISTTTTTNSVFMLFSKTKTSRFSTQWDDEEDEITTKRSTFDEARDNLRKEDDEDRMNSMGDFDANPSYSEDSVEKIREAIKKRAEALGIEQSPEQLEYRKKAEERARLVAEQRWSGGGTGQMQQMLDLSRITNDKPGGQGADGEPTIFYDPEDEMTPEEIAEADPVGELPVWQQAIETLKKSEFPSFLSATGEVFTLAFSILFTASLFIGYDYVIRNIYQYTKIIPTEEEVQRGIEERMKRRGMQQANEKDLLEGMKNFQQDIPSEL